MAELGRMVRSALVLVLLAFTAGCSPIDDLMVAIFGRSMRSQPSFDPYENPLSPPEGTVPFAAGNFAAQPDAWNTGQAQGMAPPPPYTQLELIQQVPAVVGLVNPVPATQESLARGQEVYDRSCLPCHGTQGAGDGLVTQVGMVQMSLLTEQARGYTDGYIYGMIRVGRGVMPAYAHQITHFDRWHVVNYVRSLQSASGAGADAN